MTFGYDAHGIKGTSTRAGIRERAVQLLDELVKLRQPEKPVGASSILRGVKILTICPGSVSTVDIHISRSRRNYCKRGTERREDLKLRPLT